MLSTNIVAPAEMFVGFFMLVSLVVTPYRRERI